jgi:hypothetical protein
MTRILKQEAYKGNGNFVSFKMQSQHPKAFEKMIRAQTHRVAKHFVIILNYIGPDVIHYISEKFFKMDGVQAVLPCKLVKNDGKYTIMVNKDHYHAAREQLMDDLTKWIDDNAAPDAKATLIKYQSPLEVAPINFDGISRGEHSYLKICVNTAFSVGSAISVAICNICCKSTRLRLSQHHAANVVGQIHVGRKSDKIGRSYTNVGRQSYRSQHISNRTSGHWLSKHSRSVHDH